MSAWLFAHASGIFTSTLLVSLGCAAIWEAFSPRRPFSLPAGPRWWQQFALTTVGYLLVRGCLPASAMAMALWARQEHWGLLNHLALPWWLQVPAGLIVLDLGNYALHRISHAVPLLWRVHRVHHSDIDVDCGTALRHHPLESLISQGFQLGVVVACGVAPLGVLVMLVLDTAEDLFNHANVALSPRVERLLRRVIVTPDMHRIHHSSAAPESNRNFANLFSWWDGLFATYRDAPAEGQLRMELGLSELRDPRQLSLGNLLVLPLRPLHVPARAGGSAEHAALAAHASSR